MFYINKEDFILKFYCEKNVIIDAVNKVIKTIPSKATMPILEGLLIEIEKDGTLRMAGSDTELSIETFIDVQTDNKASFVIVAKTFYDILSKLDSGTVYFELDDKKMLHIVCGVIKYDLPTMDADLYPNIPMVEKSKTITLNEKVLSSMIKQTLFSAAENDSTRSVLKGAYFEIQGSEITVVTSDIYRMAVRKENFDNKTGEDFSFIVPTKTLSEMVKIMQNDDEDVRIGIANTHIVIEFEQTKMTSRLISGEYIKYKSLLGRDYKTSVQFKCADLVKAIDRASVIMTDKVRNVIKTSFEYDSIIVYCRTPEGQSFTDEIPAEKNGENIEMGFKGKYLVDALNGSDEEEVVFYIDSPRTPICVKPTQGDKFIYIISPRKIDND